ncbi:MAG: hypothetical protein IM516_02545 [Pseudanabaena sp. M158S2SP1A06QC]|uniref:hypothetical protein n=1 Tax=Pseudanabaena mucicola TaxID=71190 RepID=UPI0025784687|nr:hypothetical protein [Pseudanabaena mucicola]MCA6572798.1 hypothetical protein [Pseudanabaena sp. M53BS1SP1A06MG]MCA6582945.1 hypothetical protein [Pseudanabaena sp. M34BS1SP1A06MG]MCA6587281.1 hypothetical protein [Pseudanabaena sp. M051S1SP1A06QC]MCA6588010.1 hypothetical protein [Pseudanabaena sp. M109S1SP1A06QC]MCA6590569.1 hypothetical protein [Pseudanabaena sp. M38BS1SP1A06MG]MCA6595980.1 hypothetical protein [Pseudanabaena sp. M046S1SP1A06QC]MCA6601784.1 hypothetical protein [Pseud
MSTRFSWLASSLVVASALLSSGAAFANPLLTDQDQYPRNFPATYPQVQNKVLDMTSDPNVPNPYIQTTYRDQWVERQNSAMRAIHREMIDLQTISDAAIRTRDLPSSYCSSLLAEGFNACAAPEEPSPAVPAPRVETPAAVPAAPVPALW